MIESQRQAYLEAMDILVWVRKPSDDNLNRLLLGPGAGSTLLLCREAEESAALVAADVCRYLGDAPVWAWPDRDENPQALSLKEAIEQHLFTRVVLLGTALAARLFKGEAPRIVGSAQIVVAADLDELALSAVARKELWQALSGSAQVTTT